MNEQEIQEVRNRAAKARQLLEDLEPYFIDTEKSLLMAAKGTKTENEALRAVIALQVFDLIKNTIAARIADEKVVEFNFKDKRFGIF